MSLNIINVDIGSKVVIAYRVGIGLMITTTFHILGVLVSTIHKGGQMNLKPSEVKVQLKEAEEGDKDRTYCESRKN